MRQNSAKTGIMAPNPKFFRFWAIFPYFLGEAKTYIFPNFFLFHLYQTNRIATRAKERGFLQELTLFLAVAL